MQIVTAKLVVAAGPLPSSVSNGLQTVLSGNVKKTLICVALWLPSAVVEEGRDYLPALQPHLTRIA
jgi:hypothetical protein